MLSLFYIYIILYRKLIEKEYKSKIHLDVKLNCFAMMLNIEEILCPQPILCFVALNSSVF